MDSTEITRLQEQLVDHSVNDKRSVGSLSHFLVSREEGIIIGTWGDLHLHFSSFLSCKLLICAAFFLVDVVDDLRDGVADTHDYCGPRDGLALLMD